MNTYSTRIARIPACWNGQIGYQPELKRKTARGHVRVIEGPIWASRSVAEADAARMLAAADAYFEAE